MTDRLDLQELDSVTVQLLTQLRALLEANGQHGPLALQDAIEARLVAVNRRTLAVAR